MAEPDPLTPPPDDSSAQTWAAAAARLRRLHRIQLLVLAVFALGVLTVVAASVVLHDRHAERHHALDDAIYEVSDAFDELRAAHASILGNGRVSAEDAVRVLTARGRLQDVHDRQGQDFASTPELDRGADDTLAALDDLLSAGQAPASLLAPPDLVEPIGVLNVAGARWFDALRDARTIDDRRGEAIRSRLFGTTFAMVLLLSAGALLLWRGLGRARGRLVDELRRTGDEHDAMRRLALAAAGDADLDELRRVAEEAFAAPLQAARVRVTHGEEAQAERELAAAGTGPPGVARREVAAGGSTWGVVTVEWADGSCPSGVAPRLDRLAATLGIAVERMNARASLQAQAVTDSLTGLPNHRAFHDALAAHLAHAADTGEPVAVAVFDVDALGDVNATYGHVTGDDVIAEVARRITALAAPGDLVARISGQALGWIMPGGDDHSAATRAEAARRAVAATDVGSVGEVTVSAGIAGSGDAALSSDLMRAADRALRAAKHAGRDTVRTHAAVVASGEAPPDGPDTAAQRREFAALQALARAVDLRDQNTQRHSERVAAVSHRLALELGWDERRAARLRQAALVHDVGKVGVPDAVLLKPGQLTSAERAIIEAHATLGAQIVSEVLDPEQVAWVRGHHERIDGGGYPEGLLGPEIPDGARVMAVADTWDAMTADRPYRVGMPAEQALGICREVAGTQLCQHCVNGLVVLFERGELSGPQDP